MSNLNDRRNPNDTPQTRTTPTHQNRKEFLYRKESSNFFNQGLDYLNNKFKKLSHLIADTTETTTTEGFGGILNNFNSSNSLLQQKITSDSTANTTIGTNLTRNIQKYNNARDALNKKTLDYLDNSSNIIRNRNIFIDRAPEPNVTNKSVCISASSLLPSSPPDVGFNNAYSRPFSSFIDAREACKTWAIDSDKTRFAITKKTGGSGYNCHVGTSATMNRALYQTSEVAYKVVIPGSGTMPNRGGLFKNGLIGVYTENTSSSANAISDAYLISTITTLQNKPDIIATFNNATNNPWINIPSWSPASFPVRDARWIWKGGDTSNYIYCFYKNELALDISGVIHMIVDNQIITVTVNGIQLVGLSGKSIYAPVTTINIKPGLNIFEFYLRNYGGPRGFVFALMKLTDNEKLITSGVDSVNKDTTLWGSSTTQLTYADLVTKNSNNLKHIQYMNSGSKYTHTTAKMAPYRKCDAFYGGTLLESSIQASFGRNCNTQSSPPLNGRYIMVKNRTNAPAVLQIVQLAVYGYDANGQHLNLAVKGRLNYAGTPKGSVTASESYVLCSPETKPNNKYQAIDGHMGNRSYNNCTGGYLSNDTTNAFWLLDLGMIYDITKIVYYNRLEEMYRERANGVTIGLYTTDPTPSTNPSASPIRSYTLNSNLKQEFEVV